MSSKSATSVQPRSLKQASPSIYRLLAQLRRKIRGYVLWEGMAWVLIWILLAFWVFLAIDYLPVTFGLNEMSPLMRRLALVVTGLGIGWIFLRWVLLRIFVRLNDESMAMLVERKYPAFDESLVTTVNYFEQKRGDQKRADQDTRPVASTDMCRHTKSIAESNVPKVDLATIFNAQSLKLKLALAVLVALSVVSLGVAKPAFTQHAAQRLYLLDSKPWPRETRLEMVGVKITRENPVEGISELGETRPPQQDEFRIARGATITLLVRAEVDSAGSEKRRLPENCRIVYRADDGSGGSLTMNRIGAPRNGFQLYTFEGQPFSGILSDIQFEIRGGDHRIGPYQISVVAPPTIIATKLGCVYPNYMVDETSMRWTPRELNWTGQASIPVGTKVTVRSTANKPINKVYAYDVVSKQMEHFPVSGDSFEISLEPLTEAVNRELYLCDNDGLVSEQPYPITLQPIEDLPPFVQTQLVGIGTAVTPKVRIPFTGVINDDYGWGKVWLELESSNETFWKEFIQVPPSGKMSGGFDFLEKKRRGDQTLDTGSESTLSLIVKAVDKYDLSESPNEGFGDKYVLDVVDENQLVRILERSEVAQRRRLEQIYNELEDARNYLVRTRSQKSGTSIAIEPGEENEPGDAPADNVQRLEVRLLYAQRTIIQIDKSSQEIIGVADAFESIRLQLINNRIDSEDRKTRIQTQAEQPLRSIANELLVSLTQSVAELETRLKQIEQTSSEGLSDPADQAALTTEITETAIGQTDVVLTRLNLVLNALVKYETQNELLEIVRKMIQHQEELLERTKKERQEKAFEGLLD